MRIVVWFSCGAASACAGKLAVEKYGNSAHLVYCDTLKSEHPDNLRFLSDIERWTGMPVEIICSRSYSDIDQVFESEHYMAGIHGARCTVEMKKVPRFEYQQPDDLHIFGLTVDEAVRIRQFEQANPELNLEWNLRDRFLRKRDCYDWLKRSGIELPVMYSLGFRNNNCIGCVKATSAGYWNRVRRYFPQVFDKRARQSRELDVRLVRWQGERRFLDELPMQATASDDDIECGPMCVQPAFDFQC